MSEVHLETKEITECCLWVELLINQNIEMTKEMTFSAIDATLC